MELEAKLQAMQSRRRERHRQDVEYVKAHHPELAAWLSEMTAEFGRCYYRVTLRCDTGDEAT